MAPYKKMPSESTMDARWWRPKVWLLAAVSLFVVLVFWSLPDENPAQLSSAQLGGL